MPTALPEPATVAALLASYRAWAPTTERPRRAHVVAGRAAGVDWRTARRGFEHGWPGVEALREVLAREQVIARAMLTREALAVRIHAAQADAAEDGAKARAAEAIVARAAQAMAGGLLADVTALVPRARVLVERITAETPADAKAATQALISLVTLARSAVDLVAAAQAVERQALGEPGLIVGLVHGGPPAPMSTEDAEVELQAAQRALAMVRADAPQEAQPDVDGSNGAS